MKALRVLAVTVPLAVLAVGSAAAQTAEAVLKDAKGNDVGRAMLTETEEGVLIKLTVEGLPPGEHAFHIHERGECEPPFVSAGGHFNPESKKHGLMAPGGPHAGDMPNLHIPPRGTLTVEVLNGDVTLKKNEENSLLRPGGTALVIHAGTDDYKTDPTGEAGGRIACGVIK